jgi:hypothetical protein
LSPRLKEADASYANVISEEAIQDARRLLEEGVAWGTSVYLTSLEEMPAEGLLALEGLGKEVWEGVDPREYIRTLRDEWGAP